MQKHNLGVVVLLLITNVLKHSVGVSVSYSDEDVEIKITRECIVTKECEFYTNLIKLQRENLLRVDKQILTDELNKQNCGWMDDLHPMGK